MLRAPWATSLRCHGALGVPPATLRRVCCDATVTCFRGDLTALVLSMFKTWRRPRRPWRPYCDLLRCHGALWDLTTTRRRSAAVWPILQSAARSPSCVSGVLTNLQKNKGKINQWHRHKSNQITTVCTYITVTACASKRLKSPADRLFGQQCVQAIAPH